jgi:tetratricopeptide (TPR) repeat protein
MLNAPAPPPWDARVRIYREALLQATELGRPQLWASLQVSLAQELLDDRSRSRAESLEEAIEGLHEAARIFREEGLPIPWAEACTSLAIAFLERIRGPRQENLEAALRFCRRALQVQSRRSRPAAWAEVADCLASALAARARPPRAVYLEKSVDLFRRVLPIRKRAPDPAGWVSTSTHLARTLNERIQGDRAESLEEAIELLRNAEQALLGQNATSPQWAIVQNNLAVMYRERLRGDSTANREQAIDILSALLARPQHLQPIDRGRALHLLAALHVERTRGRRAENLERAIALYQQALEIHTRDDLPQRWVETTQNLATAYAERLEGDPASNLERAIALYRQVLDQVDRQQAPEDWAVAASNLATACSDRLEGDRKQSLQEAVALYRQVLEVRREMDPRGQALTQMNLGNTFARLELGGEPGAFEAARDAYRQALEVHQISTLPGEHRRTQGNLADLFFARQSWQEALEAYRSALAAGEILYRSAATPEARRAMLRASLDYFLRAAWCLARLGRPGEALELLERSRTRSLNEALDLTESLLQRLPGPLRTALATTRERIASLEAQSRRLGADEREEFLRITEATGRHRAYLEEILERVRATGLDVLSGGMNAAAVVALASELEAAVVYLITTSHGSLGLLARPAAEEIESLFLDQFRQ